VPEQLPPQKDLKLIEKEREQQKLWTWVKKILPNK
jgi:hypothetical protein